MNFGQSSGSNGEVELNLAPILDCLTVLVAFLLASASFLSLTALETGIAAQSSEAAPQEQAPTLLYVRLTSQGQFKAHWDKESEATFSELEDVSRVLTQKPQARKLLALSIDPSVPIQRVIETLDQWRKLKTGVSITLATE